jgi:hypothetical protein
VLAWFANTLKITRAAVRFAVTALTPTSSAPTAFLSPEIINILSKQCLLIDQSEKVAALDDTKPSTHDFIDNELAWFTNTLQVPRAAFRYAITALTPKSSVPARFRSPEILNILSRQCPLIVTTCEVGGLDAPKPMVCCRLFELPLVTLLQR